MDLLWVKLVHFFEEMLNRKNHFDFVWPLAKSVQIYIHFFWKFASMHSFCKSLSLNPCQKLQLLLKFFAPFSKKMLWLLSIAFFKKQICKRVKSLWVSKYWHGWYFYAQNLYNQIIQTYQPQMNPNFQLSLIKKDQRRANSTCNANFLGKKMFYVNSV